MKNFVFFQSQNHILIFQNWNLWACSKKIIVTWSLFKVWESWEIIEYMNNDSEVKNDQVSERKNNRLQNKFHKNCMHFFYFLLDFLWLLFLIFKSYILDFLFWFCFLLHFLTNFFNCKITSSYFRIEISEHAARR